MIFKRIADRIFNYFRFKKKDDSINSFLIKNGINPNNREDDVNALIYDIIKSNKIIDTNDMSILTNHMLSFEQVSTFKRAIEYGISLSLFGYKELTPKEMDIAITALIERGKGSSILRNYVNPNYRKIVNSRFKRFGLDIDDYLLLEHVIIIDYCIKSDIDLGNLKYLNIYYKVNESAFICYTLSLIKNNVVNKY